MAKLPVSKKVKLRFKKKTGAGVANDKDSRETGFDPYCAINLPSSWGVFACIAALPTKLAFSSMARRGDLMSPWRLAPACNVHRSVARTFPSTKPWMVTNPARMSPATVAWLPMVNFPVDVMFPSTSPSITNSLLNFTSPVIETPLDILLGAEP